MKRVIEWFASLLLLVVTLPLQLLIALVIRLDSPGPALFVQDRLGRDGRIFRMYKFRTLQWKPGAQPVLNADGSTQVTSSDARLTRVGKYLRSGWDELPQLMNVLKGDMALIGPRPDAPFHRQYYRVREEGKLKVLPGITGLPQALGRNEIPWKQRIALDLRYIEEYSLWLDLKLVLLTIGVLWRGKGLYQQDSSATKKEEAPSDNSQVHTGAQ